MSTFTPEIGDKICLAISQGTSLRTICKKLKISPAVVCKWVDMPGNEAFREQYIRARDAMADTLAEDILDIADDESLPADSRRIRVDVRKWYAGKVKPKKYGDRADSEVTIKKSFEDMTDDELLAHARAKGIACERVGAARRDGEKE